MQAGQPITFNGSTAALRKIENLSVLSNLSGQALAFETDGTTRLNIAADGNASFSGDLTIQGSVSIEGTTTTINATQVDIGDNIIVLNAGEASTPTMDAGVEIERGTATNVSVLWNETDDRWDVSGGTFNAPTLSENTVNLEDKYLGLSGGTMTGALNMGSQKITGLATPTAATDAATMGYVDGRFGSVDLSTCAIKSESNTFTDDQTISGDLIVDGKIINSRPADMWSGGTFGADHISFGDIGRIYHAGNYRISLTSNGYRDNNNLWQRDVAAGLAGQVGAAQISLDPAGDILFETEATKNVGDTQAIPTRMIIDRDGNIGIGTTSPVRKLDVKGNVRINNDSYSRLEWYNDSDEIDPTDFWIAEHHNNGDFRLMRRDVDAGTWGSNLVLAADGNIGVGKTDPSERLEVNGNIKATNMLIGTEQVLHTGNLPVTAAKDENGDTVYTFDALP